MAQLSLHAGRSHSRTDSLSWGQGEGSAFPVQPSFHKAQQGFVGGEVAAWQRVSLAVLYVHIVSGSAPLY